MSPSALEQAAAEPRGDAVVWYFVDYEAFTGGPQPHWGNMTLGHRLDEVGAIDADRLLAEARRAGARRCGARPSDVRIRHIARL
jgi:hypothetical protein